MKPTERKPNFSRDQQEPGLCPLCGSTPESIRVYEKIYFYGSCPKHDVLIQHPRPTGNVLKEAYRDYFSGEHSEQSWNRSMLPVYREILGMLNRYWNGMSDGKRVLDVGSGNGFFLDLLEQAGCRVTGQDLQDHTSENDPRIQTSSLSELSDRFTRFDAITAIYVLEHVHKPLAFLKHCHRLLKEGGVLAIRIPRTRPLFFLENILELETNFLHAPWHLYDYSIPFLKALVRAAGFRTFKFGGAQTASRNRMEAAVSFALYSANSALQSISDHLVPGTSVTLLTKKTLLR